MEAYELYLFWVVPSTVSFILSLSIVLNVILTPHLRTRHFQILSALLGLSDLVKSGSWLISPKYSSAYNVCATQEYMYQGGSLVQAFLVITVCGFGLHCIKYSHAPQKRTLLWALGIQLTLLCTALVTSIYLKTARLFCGIDDLDVYEHRHRAVLVAYICVYVIPIYVLIFTGLVQCISIENKLYAYCQGRQISTADKLLQVVNRLKQYPRIIIFSWIPNLASLFVFVIQGDFNSVLGCFAALCLSCSGIFIAGQYFYHQNSYPTFLPRCFQNSNKSCHVGTHHINLSTSSNYDPTLYDLSGRFSDRSSTFTSPTSDSNSTGLVALRASLLRESHTAVL